MDTGWDRQLTNSLRSRQKKIVCPAAATVARIMHYWTGRCKKTEFIQLQSTDIYWWHFTHCNFTRDLGWGLNQKLTITHPYRCLRAVPQCIIVSTKRNFVIFPTFKRYLNEFTEIFSPFSAYTDWMAVGPSNWNMRSKDISHRLMFYNLDYDQKKQVKVELSATRWRTL